MQSWRAAETAATRAPRASTLGDAMGSVFTKLAKLESAEELKPEEDGHGDKCTHCTDGYTVPSKSVLMSCEAKPEARSGSTTPCVGGRFKGKFPIAGGDQSLRGAEHRAKSRGEEDFDKVLKEFNDVKKDQFESENRQWETLKSGMELKPDDETVCSFFGLNESADAELNVLPEEPEFYEAETTLDTGATTHAADRVDFRGYEVKESPGSRAGQQFGCAGGKALANEGQMTINMVSPLEGTPTRMCTQVTKVTRPLLSVTKITEEGKLRVVCGQVKAVIIDLQNRTLATFHKEHGLYVCMMEVRNPRYKNEQPFLRPHP